MSNLGGGGVLEGRRGGGDCRQNSSSQKRQQMTEQQKVFGESVLLRVSVGCSRGSCQECVAVCEVT